jgi:hypothetical protein
MVVGRRDGTLPRSWRQAGQWHVDLCYTTPEAAPMALGLDLGRHPWSYASQAVATGMGRGSVWLSRVAPTSAKLDSSMIYDAHCRGTTHRVFLCVRRRVISGAPLDYRFIRAVEGRKCVPASVCPRFGINTRMAVRPRPARCDKG